MPLTTHTQLPDGISQDTRSEDGHTSEPPLQQVHLAAPNNHQSIPRHHTTPPHSYGNNCTALTMQHSPFLWWGVVTEVSRNLMSVCLPVCFA
jgi:hypothetical protein